MNRRCTVCRSLVDDEELFCPNCGTEAPLDKPADRPPDAARTTKDNFQCQGCGASMSYDASAHALRCPFCGSVELAKRQDARVLSPQRVIPFQVRRENAEAAMREWLGRGFWRPGRLASEAAVVKISPVYVPYWVFNAQTFTYWSADTSHTPAGARGNWYPMTGDHRGRYSGLLVGASRALAPEETWRICPFDLSTGVPPEQVDLDNVTVEQFSLPRKYARPLARQDLEAREAAACAAAYVPGRSRNVHVNLRVEELTSEPVLLPVWIMAYRYRDRLYRFLVNGQTGRAAGQAPISWTKVLVVTAIAVGAAILAAILLSGAFPLR